MRTPRRILLMLLVLALALAIPLGATAGARGKPAPQYSYVTMELVTEADGLATTCPDPPGLINPIRMVQGPGGRLGAGGAWGGDDPNLRIEGTFGGTILTGCHGDQVERSPYPYPGQLLITRDVNDNPKDIKFWFDAYATKPQKKDNGLQSRYYIESTALTTVNGVTSGVFSLVFWQKGVGDTLLGTSTLTFTFGVDP